MCGSKPLVSHTGAATLGGRLTGGAANMAANKKSDHQLATEQLQADNPGATILHASGGKNSGSKNLAKVHRAEWEDYISRFAPIEDKLIAMYNDGEGRAESVEKAGETAGLAFNRSREQTDRTFSRYGLNLTDRQKTSRDKNQALEKTAAMAGAKNSMREAKEDQRMNIMSGGLSTAKQAKQTTGA
jgi:hypothetical protein